MHKHLIWFIMIIDKTKDSNLSQGYSWKGQVGRLGQGGPSVSPQLCFSPDANGGVLSEEQTMVAERKTEVNVGAALTL